MPRRSRTPCRYSDDDGVACPNTISLTESPHGYCDDHRKYARWGKPARMPWHDYNSIEWDRARKAKLLRDPDCERCGEPASDVHHRTSLRELWEANGGVLPANAHAIENLESLCVTHHRIETQREIAERRKSQVGAE